MIPKRKLTFTLPSFWEFWGEKHRNKESSGSQSPTFLHLCRWLISFQDYERSKDSWGLERPNGVIFHHGKRHPLHPIALWYLGKTIGWCSRKGTVRQMSLREGSGAQQHLAQDVGNSHRADSQGNGLTMTMVILVVFPIHVGPNTLLIL